MGEAAEKMDHAGRAVGEREGKYLTFTLAGEEYGIGILNIKGVDIEDTPSFGTSLDMEYILGMAKIDKEVKILLDIEKVLSLDELILLKNAA